MSSHRSPSRRRWPAEARHVRRGTVGRSTLALHGAAPRCRLPDAVSGTSLMIRGGWCARASKPSSGAARIQSATDEHPSSVGRRRPGGAAGLGGVYAALAPRRRLGGAVGAGPRARVQRGGGHTRRPARAHGPPPPPRSFPPSAAQHHTREPAAEMPRVRGYHAPASSAKACGVPSRRQASPKSPRHPPRAPPPSPWPRRRGQVE